MPLFEQSDKKFPDKDKNVDYILTNPYFSKTFQKIHGFPFSQSSLAMLTSLPF